jgi:hypothetical protein
VLEFIERQLQAGPEETVRPEENEQQ